MSIPETAVPTLVAAAPEPVAEQRSAVLRWLLRLFFALLAVAVVAAVAMFFVVLRGGWYAARPITLRAPGTPPAGTDAGTYSKIEKKIAALSPKGVWIAVDTHDNRLRIYRDSELLRAAICSTGSGTILKDPESGREWVFDTPQGEQQVQRKVKNPIWSKPDWAFIEEGYKPPPPGSKDRFDDFSLGGYALYLGDGYLIHGTIFQSLLGRRVTHGCIRLGDADLEYAYKTVPLGARVYLY